MMPEWKTLTQTLPSLNKLIDMYDNSKSNIGSSTNVGDIQISMTLPNVVNYEQFKRELSKDNQFKGLLFTEINSALTGKNSLKGKKFIK